MPSRQRNPHPIQLKDTLPMLRCRCGKVFAPSKDTAKSMRRQIAALKGHNNPVRYYQCEYDGWHWTEQLTITRICPVCGEHFDPQQQRETGHTVCDPCWDREHPPLPAPRPIPAPANGRPPSPAIFARRTTR